MALHRHTRSTSEAAQEVKPTGSSRRGSPRCFNFAPVVLERGTPRFHPGKVDLCVELQILLATGYEHFRNDNLDSPAKAAAISRK